MNLQRFLSFLSCLLVSSCVAQTTPKPKNGDPASKKGRHESNGWTHLAQVTDKRMAEISGLAVSSTEKGVLWAHNDGNDSNLYALGEKGEVRGVVAITGAESLYDWEDLAPFSLGGKPYLLIADTGDNTRKRTEVFLHAIPEPVGLPSKTAVSWTIPFRYEDGPQDCEAVAVDQATNTILIISKLKANTVVYSLPLKKPNSPEPAIAKKVATLAGPKEFPIQLLEVGLKRALFGSSATGADILTGTNRTLAVLTYTDCLLYTRNKEDKTWAEACQRDPKVIALPAVMQPEALCARANNTLFVTSENPPTPIYQTDPRTWKLPQPKKPASGE